VTKRLRRARHRVAVLTCTGALASGLILPVLATTAAAATAGELGPPNTFVATGPLGVAQSGQTATRPPLRRTRIWSPAARQLSTNSYRVNARLTMSATLKPERS